VGLYTAMLRPLVFALDAERAHDLAIATAERASRLPPLCAAMRAMQAVPSQRLATEAGGLRFPTPIGLAAGFDKSARGVAALAALGFGHVEVGSVSAHPSTGNPKPRLFRLPADRAIVVHYGLPNDGAEAVAARLTQRRDRTVLGINVVSTNHGPDAPPKSDDAVIGDYLASVERLAPVADYLSLNLSCPNTREGRGFFHEPARLRALLQGLDAQPPGRPLFLKVAPFAQVADLERFLGVVHDSNAVSGFSVNLPAGKPHGLRTPADALGAMPGAVSGLPAACAAERAIAELFRRMDRTRYRIIGSGGVFTAQDAYRQIRLGASLVQLLTALVYEGPGVVARLLRGLDALLARDGFERVADAVGLDA